MKLSDRNKYSILVIPGCILAVAIFFRLYRFTDIPFGLNNDAAWEGLAAIDILRGNWKENLPYAAESWRGEPVVRIMVTAFTYYFGPGPLFIPLSTVILGTLTIIPFYFLMQKLFSKHIAVLSAFFMAISGWHIIMSKSGWRAVSVPLVSTFLFLSLVNARGSTGIFWWASSGLALGLSLYTYDAGRIIPLFVIGLFLLCMIRNRSIILTHGKQLLIACVIFLVTALPMVYFASTNWTEFTGRSSYVFVGNKIYDTGNIMPLWDNILRSAILFTHQGSGNDFFINTPLLDPPLLWLFPVGFAVALWHAVGRKNRRYQFVMVWFLVSLLPGILSLPNGNRGIGAMPAVYFFTAVGALSVASFLTRRAGKHTVLTKNLILVYVCVFSLITTYVIYFSPYRRDVPGFYPETKIVTDYIKTIRNSYDIAVTDNYPEELLLFYLYRSGNPFEKTYTKVETAEKLLTMQPPVGRGLALVLFATEANEKRADAYLKKYPGAKKQVLWYTDGPIRRPAGLIILLSPMH
jgi:4-amino-4-deoxy-L-arabinose transferase-like glycosyltransferase